MADEFTLERLREMQRKIDAETSAELLFGLKQTIQHLFKFQTLFHFGGRNMDKTEEQRRFVLAQREAYVSGALREIGSVEVMRIPGMLRDAREEAARKYPMPPVTRPRVVRSVTGTSYRLGAAGFIESQYHNDTRWNRSGLNEIENIATTTKAMRNNLLAVFNVLDNPTETVPAE